MAQKVPEKRGTLARSQLRDRLDSLVELSEVLVHIVKKPLECPGVLPISNDRGELGIIQAPRHPCIVARIPPLIAHRPVALA